MRGLYGSLYHQPYLYGSDTLKQFTNNARSDEEYEAVQRYMERFDVFDKPEYAGYLSVTRSIQEELYEPEAISWEELFGQYTAMIEFDGTIRFKPLNKSLIGNDASA
jgi:hypothetical protein